VEKKKVIAKKLVPISVLIVRPEQQTEKFVKIQGSVQMQI
jgi:hypothetical protein